MQKQKAKTGYKLVTLFPNYLSTEIPIDWELSHFREVTEKISDRDHVTPTYVEKGIPIISPTNIKDNMTIDLSKIKYISLQDHEENYKNTDLRPDDIIFSRIGSIGRAYLITENFYNFSILHSLCQIRVNEKTLPKYLLNFLRGNLIQKRIWVTIQSIGVPDLGLGEIGELPIFLPPLSEQKKIASILTNVDNLIDSYGKAIESTTRLKRGLTQQLLTKGINHKKFKKVKWLFGKEIEIPNNWISKKVEDVFKLKSGSTPSRTKPEFFEGDISWVTSTDLNRSKIISTIEKITKDAVKDANLTIFPKGTFLIATYGLEAAGTRGKCGILEMDATCNQACMAFLPSSEMISVFLFYFYLFFGEKIVFNIAQGTKQQNLYSDTVNKVTLLIPPLKEQEKIISILSEIDSKISDLESKKSRIESLKKGLMQKLLTGRIRVN